MIISKCDNFLMTAQKQSIIVGANCISLTVKRGEKKKNIKNGVTFVTFVTLHSLT